MREGFVSLRQSLIDEAVKSPKLLSDLAGLESYVAESYNCRSFIELLQNADDAKAERFYVKQFGDYLIVANDGRVFSISDMESLCRSASSNKMRGSSIGYRGIGFKSVVGFAKEVHLLSGEFEVTFSKSLSKQVIPEATRVPLIRIPHDIDCSVKSVLQDQLIKLQRDGYKTIFIFSGVIANQIKEEYSHFPNTLLLFLNNIRKIVIDLERTEIATIVETGANEFGRKIRISSPENVSDWLVCTEKNCCIAFSLGEGEEILRLPNLEANIHAFLPTEDSCGLGVIVNGDFSTDPSRRHLIFDETTNNVISQLSKYYGRLLKKALEKHDAGMLEALIPYFDLRLIQLMKQSFEQEFAKQVKVTSGTLFSKLRLAPEWFNISDYYKINEQAIVPECAKIEGLNRLLKYLGSKNDSITSILDNINRKGVSITGYAQVVVEGIKCFLMNRKIERFIEIPLFMSNNILCSLTEIESEGKSIDESYIQLLLNNGLKENEIAHFFKKQGLSQVYNVQLPDDTKIQTNKEEESDDNGDVQNVIEWFNDMSSQTSLIIRNNSDIKRWRSAESNALQALNANGFNLKDVSSLNLGYDLEGLDPNGKEIFIEVKSIDYIGQKFRMTNNEFAAAQYKQESYYIAIVMMDTKKLELSLIRNPVNSLKMSRVCVQWVWECNEYIYRPMTFIL